MGQLRSLVMVTLPEARRFLALIAGSGFRISKMDIAILFTTQ